MKIKPKDVYSSLLFFFIVLPFFMPMSVYSMSAFSPYLFILSLWEYCSVFIMLCADLCTLKKSRNFSDIYYYFAVRVFCASVIQWILFSTVSFSAVYRSVRTLLIVCYIAKAFLYSYDKTLKRVFYITTVLCIANAVTVMLFPNGMYVDANLQNYLLGYKNGLAIFIFPTMCFAIMYMNNTKKCFLPVVCILSGGYSILFTYSSTAIAGYTIFCIILLFCKFQFVRKYFLKWKNIIFVIVVCFIVINLLQAQFNILSFVADAFNKDTTFTGRTDLWKAAIKSVLHYPLFGVGEETSYLSRLFTLHLQKLSYAHDEMLDVLVRFGLVGAFFYCGIIYKTVINSKYIKAEMFAILPFFVSMWIMMLFESYSNYSYYFLYFVILLLCRIINQREKDTKSNIQVCK